MNARVELQHISLFNPLTRVCVPGWLFDLLRACLAKGVIFSATKASLRIVAKQSGAVLDKATFPGSFNLASHDETATRDTVQKESRRPTLNASPGLRKKSDHSDRIRQGDTRINKRQRQRLESFANYSQGHFFYADSRHLTKFRFQAKPCRSVS